MITTLLSKLRGLLGRATPVPAAAVGPTVAFAAPLFIESRVAKNCRPSTITNYRCWLARAIRSYGSRPLASLNDDDLLTIIAEHCYDEACYYVAFLRWCVHTRILPAHHDMPRLPPQRLEDKPRPSYMRAEDVRTYLRTVHEIAPDLLAGFLLGFYAGLRPMEICRIRWEEIHVAEQWLTVESDVSKTRDMRIVQHIPPLLWHLLEPLAKASGPVMPFDTPDLAMFAWIRVRKAAGDIAGLRISHDFIRHTFATHLVAMTGNLSLTAMVLGHVGLKQLQRHYNGRATRAEGDAYFSMAQDAADTYRKTVSAIVALHLAQVHGNIGGSGKEALT
ncbi:MAG: site-specific integrase [Verrucomicrobiaceae bacterium]|nr:site-specific integrase [Verrucomicrobiaceae bacterium]